MQTTAELIKRISPRYKKVRNEKLDFLWKDFLGAVEKVTNKLSDEKFAATSGITICYFTKEGNIYRSKIAECSFFEEEEVQYEEEDICLGTKEMLKIAFFDFKSKAENDKNICTSWFELEKFDEDENKEENKANRIPLDFILPKKL